MAGMDTIKQSDKGPAVEDVQHRLARIGLLDSAHVDGTFGQETAQAVRAFCKKERFLHIVQKYVEPVVKLRNRTAYLS